MVNFRFRQMFFPVRGECAFSVTVFENAQQTMTAKPFLGSRCAEV